MKQEVEAGDWVEAGTVIKDVLVVEAGEDGHVGRPIIRKDSRKLDGNLRKMVEVPNGLGPVHRG